MKPRGLTLIEVTVVLAVIAVLFAASAMAVGAITGSKARATAGELGGVIRSLYDTAALSGRTCRLVFELAEEKDEEGVTRYWAECAAGNLTSSLDRERELKEANRTDRREEEEKRRSSSGSQPNLQDLLAVEKERVEEKAKFAQFTSPEIEPRELPPAVRLGVWTRHQRQVAKAGLAFLYFYPQGFTEKAQLYVRQGDHVWTLSVQPLTGKVAIVTEELEVPKG